MGLCISHLDAVTIKSERSLYLYLLDFGWPDGQWEQLFKRHFMALADRASRSKAAVIGSMRGVHFADEVLSWHKVGQLSAEEVLPALLITKTHPSYFAGGGQDVGSGIETLLVIPLKPICTGETEFLRTIEGIFRDLERGLELKNFQVAQHDVRANNVSMLGRLSSAIEVKPGAFGVSVDLKSLLFRR